VVARGYLHTAHGGITKGNSAGQSTQLLRVYPYSLIPGGVERAEEFQAYRAVDKVLASHYNGIGNNLIRTTLSSEKWLYASYRVADEIYWTKNRIAVHQGEAVLTDGSNLVRARCGNRLSEKPRLPVRKFEPPVVTTDVFVPRPPYVPEEVPGIPPEPPVTPRLPPFPSVLPPIAPAPPVIVPPAKSVGAPLPPPGPTPPTIWLPPPGSKTPVVAVPEAHTTILMLSGLLTMLAAMAFRGARKRC
jgi:hypothetical protein